MVSEFGVVIVDDSVLVAALFHISVHVRNNKGNLKRTTEGQWCLRAETSGFSGMFQVFSFHRRRFRVPINRSIEQKQNGTRQART